MALTAAAIIASGAAGWPGSTSYTGHSPVPYSGVDGQWNKPMCGSNAFERVQTTVTEFAVNDSTGTCVNSTRYITRFSVAKVIRNIGWQYPNISSGYVPEGETTCANPAQDHCFAYPVQAKYDGHPVASFSSWLNPGSYNESFDTWFSPIKSHHSVQTRAGNTEIMIWTAYPGIHDRLYNFFTVNGMRFGTMSWEAHGSWRYVAYLWLNAPHIGNRGRSLTIRNLPLNPFFTNAEHHGWLSQNEYLWAIDLGFEMNWGGRGNNIHSYSLTGMPYAPVDHLTLARPANQATVIGTTVRLPLHARSSENWRISYATSRLPSGLRLYGSVISGRVTGIPSWQRVTVTARDRAGSVRRVAFTWITKR